MDGVCDVCEKIKTEVWGGGEGNRALGFGILAAAYLGHHKCVEVLLNQGADFDATERKFNYDNRRKVEEIAGVEIKTNFWFKAHERSPLAYAAENCHEKCVQLLIEAGANVKLGQSNIHTKENLALHAALPGYSCLKLLLNALGDANCTDSNGRSLLTETAVKCYTSKGRNLTTKAEVLADSLRYIKLFLKYGALVNNGRNAFECFLESKMGYSIHRNLLQTPFVFTFRPTFTDSEIKVLLALAAAGEAVLQFYTIFGKKYAIPPPLKTLVPPLCFELRFFSRKRIRKCLLDLDSQQNLFIRIPLLGLPSLVNEYLLYGISIDNEDGEGTEEKEKGEKTKE